VNERTIPSLSNPPASKLEADFHRYHEEHPEVYDKLKKLSLELLSRGIKHYGIAALVEVVRYHGTVSASRADEYKIPNNTRPYYARLLMANCPELEGFFTTRTLRTKPWPEPKKMFLDLVSD
jgi:hypothetical protein